MTTRPRWQGWTLVDEDGNLVLSTVTIKPLIWRYKPEAREYLSGDEKIVRCELRLIK